MRRPKPGHDLPLLAPPGRARATAAEYLRRAMAVPFLNVDAGELDDEPAELYALAHAVSIACGGHAGDARSMERVLRACAAARTRAGAHPSYEDREGFGRRDRVIAPDVLRASLERQCGALAAIARACGVTLSHVKPHGALYHAANRDPDVARAVVGAAVAALGAPLVVGPPEGELRRAAAAAGLAFAREGFADRALREDGSLVPRGEPGALLAEPGRACCALPSACARDQGDVRHALRPRRLSGRSRDRARGPRGARFALEADDARGARGRGVRPIGRVEGIEPVGDGAVRWERDPGRDARKLLDALRAHPGVVDAIVTEEHALVTFDPARPPDAPWAVEDAVPPAHTASSGREHLVRARYDGPDLDSVAASASVSRDEIVRAHAGAVYAVKLVGFLPGFAYLGPVAPLLALPRRPTPRPRVEPGAIGIAGGYTGIYPFASPGGWHLLARAIELTPFDAERGALFALGDRVRFEVVR